MKDRWAARDPALVAGMAELGELAKAAVRCLHAQDFGTLGNLMRRNFAIRRSLYGDAVVGAANIGMVDLAQQCGMSAKFTGSGGAIVCMREDGRWWRQDDAEEKRREDEVTALFAGRGFGFERIRFSEHNAL